MCLTKKLKMDKRSAEVKYGFHNYKVQLFLSLE